MDVDEDDAVAEHQVDDGGDVLGHVLLKVLHVLPVLVENLAIRSQKCETNLAWHLLGVPTDQPAGRPPGPCREGGLVERHTDGVKGHRQAD